MGIASAFTFSSPIILMIALALGCATAVIPLKRRPALPRSSRWLAAVGLLLLCIASGEPLWNKPAPGEVAVMVDLSASTRTADYRGRTALDRRIAQLLGTVRHRVYYFASEISPSPISGDPLPDLPADRTVFQPPAGATAVVLFSDGRFEIPSVAPPTYVVVDPGLESPADAAVTGLEVRGREVIASVTNASGPRPLTFTGTGGDPSATVQGGAYSLVRTIDPKASELSARLAPGDPWPENDQLTALPPPTEEQQRWWVGRGGASPGWRTFSPAQLPVDPAAYLAPSIIVLDNISAGELSDLQQQRLQQYVRDLGGTLLILGGDRAFAAGAYPGTTLEALSPLASTPPEPTTHWIVLADSSGSMAAAEGGFSRWQYVTDAIVRLLPRLPPDDLLSVGSFAESLTWWCNGVRVRDAKRIPLPPRDVFPHGPTNLEFALREVARTSEGNLPESLLLLTDADAQIDDPNALAQALKQKRIRVHLLAIGNGSGLPALQIIINATGGTLIRQFDPQRWTAGVQELMRSASPKLLETTPIQVKFLGDFSTIPPKIANPWNRTSLKSSATPLAEGTFGDSRVILGAQWNRGEGRVAAFAFDANLAAVEPIISALVRPPRDPRFRVSWDAGARLHVKVEAIDRQSYINHADLYLELSQGLDAQGFLRSLVIPQTAPGEYEILLDASRSSVFAAVRANGRVLDRVALAGRYAPEFEAIGNDHPAMRRLAERTGGRVILPSQVTPVDFQWPRRPVPLLSLFAALGALLVGLSLIAWKLG